MRVIESEFERPPLVPITLNPAYLLAHIGAGAVEIVRRDLKVKGSAKFPSKGPALLGPSHNQSNDPETASVCFRRPIDFMMKKELQSAEYLYFGYVLRLLRTFPVDREHPNNPSNLKPAIRKLQRGRAVAIFAQGSRYVDAEQKIVRCNEIGELYDSIGGLAVKFNAPIVALGIGNGEIHEAGRLRNRVERAVASEPIYPQRNLSKARTKASIMAQFHDTLQAVYDEASMAAAQAADRLNTARL